LEVVRCWIIFCGGVLFCGGPATQLFEWSDEVTADCPRKRASDVNDQCGACCPDLAKVL